MTFLFRLFVIEEIIALVVIIICMVDPVVYAHESGYGAAYGIFRTTIKALIATPVSENPCGIMFTYANHNMIELLLLQRKAMQMHEQQTCFNERFITVCLDLKCKSVCDSTMIPNCIMLDIALAPLFEAKRNPYYHFIYLKHELMFEALKVVDEVFFFDVDVLLFRNPWKEIIFGRSNTGERVVKSYDIQYQRELESQHDNPSCEGGTVNTGQVYIKNSSKAQVYLQTMVGFRNLIIGGENGLDQDYVMGAYQRAGLEACSLSTNLFMAYCLDSHNSSVKLGDVISFHASCTKAEQKKSRLTKFLHAVQSNPSSPVSTVIPY